MGNIILEINRIRTIMNLSDSLLMEQIPVPVLKNILKIGPELVNDLVDLLKIEKDEALSIAKKMGQIDSRTGKMKSIEGLSTYEKTILQNTDIDTIFKILSKRIPSMRTFTDDTIKSIEKLRNIDATTLETLKTRYRQELDGLDFLNGFDDFKDDLVKKFEKDINPKLEARKTVIGQGMSQEEIQDFMLKMNEVEGLTPEMITKLAGKTSEELDIILDTLIKKIEKKTNTKGIKEKMYTYLEDDFAKNFKPLYEKLKNDIGKKRTLIQRNLDNMTDLERQNLVKNAVEYAKEQLKSKGYNTNQVNSVADFFSNDFYSKITNFVDKTGEYYKKNKNLIVTLTLIDWSLRFLGYKAAPKQFPVNWLEILGFSAIKWVPGIGAITLLGEVGYIILKAVWVSITNEPEKQEGDLLDPLYSLVGKTNITDLRKDLQKEAPQMKQVDLDNLSVDGGIPYFYDENTKQKYSLTKDSQGYWMLYQNKKLYFKDIPFQ